MNTIMIDGNTATILINSPKHGNKQYLIDAADVGLVQDHNWHLKPKPHGRNYARTNMTKPDGKQTGLYLHALIIGKSPGKQIDHINGDTYDNRRINLRWVSHAENNQNQTRAKGCYFDGHKWAALIGVNSKKIYLGRFNTEAEARAAYLTAKRIYHPAATIPIM